MIHLAYILTKVQNKICQGKIKTETQVPPTLRRLKS